MPELQTNLRKTVDTTFGKPILFSPGCPRSLARPHGLMFWFYDTPGRRTVISSPSVGINPMRKLNVSLFRADKINLLYRMRAIAVTLSPQVKELIFDQLLTVSCSLASSRSKALSMSTENLGRTPFA